MRYGYARISSDTQNLELQINALNKADCDEILTEVYTGVLMSRPVFDTLMEKLNFGDFIIVYKIDRLSRGGLIKTLQLISDLSDRGVYVISLTEGINTSNENPMAKAFLALIAVFAELERSISKERVSAGIEHAKRQGKYKGRKPKLSPKLFEKIQSEIDKGASIRDTCGLFGVSRTAYYNAKRKYKYINLQ